MKKIIEVAWVFMVLLPCIAAERPVKVTFVGDVMCQGPMLEPYRTASGWDFSGIFAGVKGLFAESDYVIANLETPLAPDDQDLTHARWEFCSPKAFAQAVKDAGIDFVFTANNHCLDRGPAGIARTVAALDAVGLPHTGTFATKAAAETPTIIDVKGFKLGLLSYTYGSNAFSNHQYLDDSNRFMVNLFQQQEVSEPLARAWYANRNSPDGRKYEEMEKTRRPENLTLPVYERQEAHDAERARLKADVARMKAAKPDFTVMSMHTGGQYNPVATKYTKELTSFLFGCGVDIISGTHEHVVHAGEFGGIDQNRLATYSLGNFDSLNGVWGEPMDKMADYSIAWHVYLDHDPQGRPRLAKTSFTVLKCIRGDRDKTIRVVPAAELYIRETDPVARRKLRADMLEIARRFCGRDFETVGVALEYPLSESSTSITVDNQIPAGNIAFEKIVGDDVYVHQELRDTKGDWFYWAMRVKGAQGRTLKFHFTKSVAVGVRGPCVSLDRGRTFAFAAEQGCTRNEFTYTFPKDADEVWFYECHPYMPSEWEAFLARHASVRGKWFETGVLCKTKKGRDVPKARFGHLAPNPRYRIFLSSRHHCSETMGTPVVEGVVAAFLADDELGRWLRANVELLVVPFMDYDGAVDGDQGKNRAPHDHNRDYNTFVHRETKATTEWIASQTGNNLDIFLDVHCPWLFGHYNEFLYTPWKDPALVRNAAAEHRFSKLLEKLQCGSMRYKASDDLPFGQAWNANKNYNQGWTCVVWAMKTQRNIKIARTFEVPFANANGAVVTPDTCRALGRDTAKVFRAILEEKTRDGEGAAATPKRDGEGAAATPKCVSGVWPHLAMFNNEGECGTGAVVPWAGSLWAVTYGPHLPVGSSDKLYQITSDMQQIVRPESVGGTPANRMVHRESNQLVIGPHVIDAQGSVRTIPPEKMPGRLTGVARHLTDPANKVYVATMEEGLYEVDMKTLAVNTLLQDDGYNKGVIAAYLKKCGAPYPPNWESTPLTKLPGYHGKGLCSGWGRVFYANNGEDSSAARRDPFVASGALADWSKPGEDWRLVRRNQFTEITTRDGIYGNEHPNDNPVWSFGWDARSVILGVNVTNVWTWYRLPKGSHCYDGAHGWNTEWPRIRAVGRANLLGTMHGTFWDFPADFSPTSARGIRPISTYLKVIGDFCLWNGRIVFGCDDSAQSEFLNKRRAKGALKGPGRSQSNLWFVDPAKLDAFGAPVGHGAVWSGDDVAAGATSDPYLFAGYANRWLWITAGAYDVQLDEKGDGAWKTWKTLGVGGHDLSAAPAAEWVRLVAREDAKKVTAVFHYSTARTAAAATPFTELAKEGAKGNLIISRHKPEVLRLATSTNACLELDASLALTHPPSFEADVARHVLEDAPIPTDVLEADAASILYVDDNGNRWRLPYGLKDDVDASRLAQEWRRRPRRRVCREVCTERDLFNAGGIFYELPALNAGGFSKIRPVSTHNLDVYDYASWRGLLVLSMADGRLLAGVADDLWRLGKPRGVGGPWKDTSAKAGVASDPYLLNGFDAKTLTLASSADAHVTLEADIDGTGLWVKAAAFDVKAGKPLTHAFPPAFAAYWVRATSSASATLTAQFVCE